MKKFLLLLLILINMSAFSQKPDISLNVYRFDSAYGNLQSVGDTTLYKPLVINSNGKFKKFTYWPATGSGSMVYPGAGISLSTGSAWGTSITDNSANWNTAYTDRLKWDGGTTGLTAATGRTSLGLDIGTNVQAYDADLTTYAGLTPTTIGSNLITLINPSAVTFPRYNADNTVTARSATELKTDLSLTPGTNIQAYDLDLDTWAGITPGGSVGTFLATPSSANLRAALTDENGTGAALFNNASTPDFTTGFTISGAASSGKIMKANGTNFIPSTETYAAPSTSGNIMTSDGTNWTSAANTGGWTVLRVSGSNATTTGQTLVDITGLVSGTLANATLYEIEVVLYVTTSTGTNGTQYGISAGGTGGAAEVFANVSGTTTAVAAGVQTINASATATTAYLTAASLSGIVTMKGFVLTRGSGTATISIQHLKVTSGTSTVRIGSVLRYRLAS